MYKGFFRKKTTINFFSKASAKVVEPPRKEYKGFKYKYNKKSDIVRFLLVRTNYNLKNNAGIKSVFVTNSSLIIKRKFELKSKFFYGPLSAYFKRKKIILLNKFLV